MQLEYYCSLEFVIWEGDNSTEMYLISDGFEVRVLLHLPGDGTYSPLQMALLETDTVATAMA